MTRAEQFAKEIPAAQKKACASLYSTITTTKTKTTKETTIATTETTTATAETTTAT